VVVIAAALFFGWLPRQKRDKQVQARARQQRTALPIVQVVTAQQSAKAEELTLPGTVVPVSTTHTIAGGIMGVGSIQRLSAVRWGVAKTIVWAWVLTIPVAGLVSAICFWILHAIFPAA